MSQGKEMNKYWIEQLREEFTKETGVDWRDQSFQDWLERKLKALFPESDDLDEMFQ